MNEARSGSKFLGRDHHARAFTVWLAGGGIKPGVTVGKTDDIGYTIVEDAVSVFLAGQSSLSDALQQGKDAIAALST